MLECTALTVLLLSAPLDVTPVGFYGLPNMTERQFRYFSSRPPTYPNTSGFYYHCQDCETRWGRHQNWRMQNFHHYRRFGD